VRHLLAGHPEQAEEAVEHRARLGRRLVGMEAAQVDEQHPVEPAQLPADLHGEPGLPDTGHAGDHRDGARGAAESRAQRALFGDPSGEVVFVRGQVLLHPHLRGRLSRPRHHPQRLPPLRHVPRIRMQRLDHRRDQVAVEPTPAQPEAVDHRGLAGQFAGRAAGGGPGRVDPFLDRLERRVAGVHLQLT
jgi:hypothetical protein